MLLPFCPLRPFPLELLLLSAGVFCSATQRWCQVQIPGRNQHLLLPIFETASQAFVQKAPAIWYSVSRVLPFLSFRVNRRGFFVVIRLIWRQNVAGFSAISALSTSSFYFLEACSQYSVLRCCLFMFTLLKSFTRAVPISIFRTEPRSCPSARLISLVFLAAGKVLCWIIGVTRLLAYC